MRAVGLGHELGREVDAEVSDEELVAGLRSGDHAAMGEVFDRYADRVYAFCFRRTASWSAAEDAMAAVFLEVWRVRGRATAYDGELLPWLYGVAANVCRNSLRGQRRLAALRARLDAAGDRQVGDHADDVAGRVDSEHRMAALLAALERLDRRDREVLMLVAWDRLAYAQAAEVLGVPVGTVRSRLARARARLSEAMDDEERSR